MPGTTKSMPKIALPFILEGFSTLGNGFPINFHWLAGFKEGLAGGFFLAAASARSPNLRLRRLARWMTFPFSARQLSGLTLHRSAAAAISISRALAPIVRIT